MLQRRFLLGGAGALLAGCSTAQTPAPVASPAPVAPPVAPPTPSPAPPASASPVVIDEAAFQRFLAGVRQEAARNGVSNAILARSLDRAKPQPRVLELDRKQPEGVLSWEQYRDRIVSQTRIQNGRRAFAENRALLQAIEARYNVSPRVIVAIWGMETNYGSNTGGFNVVDALATLAWEGRRASFFRNELMAALRILEGQHIAPERMQGSWAGAMGQPQFMPTSFERLAVDFDGDGHRDIWDNRGDALASIANYLARSGWQAGQGWAIEAQPPAGFDIQRVDTETRRSMAEWSRLGWRRADGSPLPASGDANLAVPTRSSGQVFLGLPNLRVIRRYNSPMNYGLAVGLLADAVA
ncbi:lytic transglycosylase domain-containing protein [Pseudoroseomonas cervicalis]|uniref:lytic murein transglycosylase n=1 Tax=Teichococcus cervicalis TaxID=204525 RepID=UPI0022F1B481|nr:lytic murein transglycosylase [Pseudoroseomonas cervicalis]WBV44960.1 lytic murein transglycosylase [Pseudoroseomonas cervicalis]